MSEPHDTSSARCAQSVAGTLADVDRQIAARSTGSREATHDPDALVAAEHCEDDDVEYEDDLVARLAADEVLTTNRHISQRSLREFLS
jgi:hypothetical protein